MSALVAPRFDDLPEFLVKHQVEIVASLPCYLDENVDRQRGDHVVQRSLEALQRLNSLGYGQPDSLLSSGPAQSHTTNHKSNSEPIQERAEQCGGLVREFHREHHPDRHSAERESRQYSPQRGRHA